MFNKGLDVRPVDEIGFEHHADCIERTHRQRACAERGRHFILEDCGSPRVLADEDRVRRPVWRLGLLMDEIQQQNAFAGPGVFERYAARETRRRISDTAYRAGKCEIGLRAAE